MASKPITTEVMEAGPRVYSQMGQYLHTPLHISEGKISQPLAKRLYVYACERVVDLGLALLVKRRSAPWTETSTPRTGPTTWSGAILRD
jgi:hypothetical protein